MRMIERPDRRAARTATSTCSAPPTRWRATARRTSSRSAPARSPAPAPRDGTAEGVPTGTDAFGGISWQDFLADPNPPGDPVEFGVQTAGVHNATETLEVDVLVDPGADGVYAGDDEGIPADYLVVKQAAAGRRGLRVQPLAAERARRLHGDVLRRLLELQLEPGRPGGRRARGSGSRRRTRRSPTRRPPARAASPATSRASSATRSATSTRARASTTPGSTSRDPALDIDPLVCRGFWHGRQLLGRGPDHGLDRLRRAGRRPEHPGAVPEQRPVAHADGGDHQHRAVKQRTGDAAPRARGAASRGAQANDSE